MLTDLLFSPIILLVALLLAVVLVVALRRLTSRGEERLPYYSRRFLLSRGEMAFYRVLARALPPGLVICPKVRLADLINCPGDAWRAGYGGRISGKHVDFVLADAGTLGIRLVIELDDRSHERSDRRDRDTFVDRAFDAAGIPILHVPAAASYDVRNLTERLEQAVAVMDTNNDLERV